MAIQLTNDLDNKRFASALTGVCKMSIHNDTTIDRGALLTKVFSKSSMASEQQLLFFQSLADVMATAARKGWTHVELVEELKNPEFVIISEEQVDIFGQYWKGEINNIRSSIAKATTFNHELSHFTWRIDVKSNGGDGSNDSPCALLEMNVADRVSLLCFFFLIFVAYTCIFFWKKLCDTKYHSFLPLFFCYR
jgi:hypothetical protein